MVVQHNLTAMNSNRMLGITTGQQAKSSEKLSSGYRINRAADDAAGLSISEKMRKQIRGLDQASTNAQDGVSSVQTAEGALTEVHSMLQRMNELAVQASNGTNSKDDRQAIQDEIDQLTTEIDRVAETTKFNEIYLLKGDAGTKTITLGAHDAGLKGTMTVNADGTATFVMDKLNAGDKVSIGGKEYTIGSDAAAVDKFFTDNKIEAKAGNKITLNGVEYTYYDAQAKDDAQKKDGWEAGWYAEQPTDNGDGTAEEFKAAYADLDALKDAVNKGGTIAAGGKEITGLNDGDADGVNDTDSSVISEKKAYVLASEQLLAANQIGDTKGSASVGVGKPDTAMDLNNATNTFEIKLGQADVANTLSFNLHVGADADMTNKIQVDIDSMGAAGLGVKGLNVADDTGLSATYAVDAIADATAKVSAQRSALGAVQNRLEHTIDNLDNIVENTTAAESRIRDTDMAEEMVEYSKNNILAQAGQSMLAQANQATQGVLSLLQ